MNSYLHILDKILNSGVEKYPTRSIGNVGQIDGSVKTLMLPNVHFEHDMSTGFPLLTTKKMAFKSIVVELEGFIKGITDKQWFKDRGCNIWNAWANPKAVDKKWAKHCEQHDDFDYMTKEDRISYQRITNDLGPIYGAQWRNFNGSGYDQLKYIVDTLKTNCNDRRMVCSAWNPQQFDEMALVPCHLMFTVTTSGNKLNLAFIMRSCDFLLGAPFNIASYALLLNLLSNEANLEPGLLSAIFIDCHLYENQLDVAKEQLSRTPLQLPKIKINTDSIFKWTHKDVELIDYNAHPKLSCDVII